MTHFGSDRYGMAEHCRVASVRATGQAHVCRSFRIRTLSVVCVRTSARPLECRHECKRGQIRSGSSNTGHARRPSTLQAPGVSLSNSDRISATSVADSMDERCIE